MSFKSFANATANIGKGKPDSNAKAVPAAAKAGKPAATPDAPAIKS